MTEPDTASKLEQRAWALVVGLCMLLGGWWLQNQYNTTLRLQEQLTEYIRFADTKYVQKDYLGVITQRLERIEVKLDDLREAQPDTHFNDQGRGR